jgi:C-terminal processing protease CtpA/Prc
MWGFLSTIALGLIAAMTTFTFQARSWREKNREEIRRDERQAALQTVELIGDAFDKRYHAHRKLLSALNVKDKNLESIYAEYNNEVDAWMTALSKISARLSAYFDRETATSFETECHRLLKESGDGLQLRYRYDWDLSSVDKAIASSVISNLQVARRNFQRFQRGLLERIENNEFGSVQYWNNTHHGKLEDISVLFLVSRLFGVAK